MDDAGSCVTMDQTAAQDDRLAENLDRRRRLGLGTGTTGARTDDQDTDPQHGGGDATLISETMTDADDKANRGKKLAKDILDALDEPADPEQLAYLEEKEKRDREAHEKFYERTGQKK